MQLASDAELAAAVDDPDRLPIYRVKVDWNRDGLYSHALSDISDWVTDVSVDRTAAGDLPPEVSLVEGSIAATAQVTLGGLDPNTGLALTGADGLSALETFGPYRDDSPLFGVPLLGCPIQIDLGLATDAGRRYIRQLTGQIRGLSPNSGDRTVTLSAIDYSDKLRASITMPPHAQDYANVAANNHKLEINSQAVVDFILRKNGFYASPAARSDAQVSCTGHGWLASEVGRSSTPAGTAAVISDDHWYIDDGPFNMLAVRGVWDSNTLYGQWSCREPFNPAPGNGIGISMWVRAGNDMGVTAGNRPMVQVSPLVDGNAWFFVTRMYSDGRLGGFINNGADAGFAKILTAPTDWIYVGVHFQIRADGTTLIRYRANGSGSSGSITTPLLTSTVAPVPRVTAWTNVAWTNLQVWYSYDPPTGTWPGETHTPTASIDKGANWLTHLPDVVEEESLSVLKDVVGAEYGLFGFDEAGTPAFRSRATSTDPTTVDKTVTADRSLIDLGTEVNVDSVRNVISTETTAGYLRFPKVVVESRDVTDYQAPVGISTFDVPLDWGAIPTVTQALPQIASGSWTDTLVWGFVPVQASAPTVEIASGVTVVATAVADRLVRLTVRNYSAFPVRFATTSGSPALRVAGWAMQLDPARLQQARAEGSIALYDERVYKIDASPWRQDQRSVADVAGGLLSTLSDPIPAVVRVPIVGDPRLQIGDVARIVDTAGQGSFRAYVLGVSPALAKDGPLATDITVRPVNAPGLGLLDDDELGLLDDTLILAP